MTPVILSAAQARERHATGEVAHCLCPLTQPCECGLEADLIRDGRVDMAFAGWRVR